MRADNGGLWVKEAKMQHLLKDCKSYGRNGIRPCIILCENIFSPPLFVFLRDWIGRGKAGKWLQVGRVEEEEYIKVKKNVTFATPLEIFSSISFQ